jgi:hypothetical protein
VAGEERRNAVRVGIRPIPAVFESDRRKAQGEILSLSKKGLFLRCMDIPEVSAEVRVTFKTERHEKVEVVGHVTWSTNQLEPGKYRSPGFGMRFSAWSDEYHEFYERALFTPRD